MSFALLSCTYLMTDVTEIKILSMIYHAADPGIHIRKAQLAQDSDCCIMTEIPIRDWVNCHAVPTTLSALLGVIVPGQSRKVETVFAVSDLQAVGISSVRSETDEWLLNSCVRCKRTAPCQKHPGEAEEGRTDALHFESRWPTATVRSQSCCTMTCCCAWLQTWMCNCQTRLQIPKN